MELGVDASGATVTCAVIEPSGTDALDAATCDIAKAHLRFNPATDHRGLPTAGVYRLPVRWQFPDEMPAAAIDITAGAPKDSEVVIEVTANADGIITACRTLLNRSLAEAPDPCQNVKIGQQASRRLVRNGKAVGFTIVDRYTEHVVPLP